MSGHAIVKIIKNKKNSKKIIQKLEFFEFHRKKSRKINLENEVCIIKYYLIIWEIEIFIYTF